MRKGVYSTANLRRMRLVPFGYRCGACGALNDGFYPMGISEKVRDAAEASLNATGRELTQAEQQVRNQREVWSALAQVQSRIDARKWTGSPNGVAVCGACGEKAPWSRPSMRPRDWIITMFIPLGIGVYELAYEGFFLGDPRAVLLGIIVTVIAAAVMAAAAVAMAVRKRRIDRLPRASLPTLFNEPWELEAWLNAERREGESIFASIDPRSPEAGFLAEQNEAARTQPPPETIILCKSCLSILSPDKVRTFEGKQYCPECYGLVRREAETRSYLNHHRKRGGEIM